MRQYRSAVGHVLNVERVFCLHQPFDGPTCIQYICSSMPACDEGVPQRQYTIGDNSASAKLQLADVRQLVVGGIRTVVGGNYASPMYNSVYR